MRTGPILLLCCVGAVLVTGCRAAPAGHPSGVATTSRPSAPATSTTIVTPNTTTTTTGVSGPPAGYAPAKQEWVQGASAISADTAGFLQRAATDLEGAVSAAGTNFAQYNKAIQELRQLASIPETSDTPGQMSEAQSDVAALNAFFGTSGLYS